jgi:hypothetical protein
MQRADEREPTRAEAESGSDSTASSVAFLCAALAGAACVLCLGHGAATHALGWSAIVCGAAAVGVRHL